MLGSWSWIAKKLGQKGVPWSPGGPEDVELSEEAESSEDVRPCGNARAALYACLSGFDHERLRFGKWADSVRTAPLAQE